MRDGLLTHVHPNLHIDSPGEERMSFPRLYAGPDPPALDRLAFETLVDRVPSQPESVRYLTPQDYPREPVRDRWRDVGPSAGLTVETLDDFVTRCEERLHYRGRTTHVDRPLLFRLVELGVEGIDDPDNPLYSEQFPGNGTVEAAEALFTALEFAGLLSAEAMRERLAAEGLGDRADHVATLAAEIRAARSTILADELPETYRTERMHGVATADADLRDVAPGVEAVVLAGFTRFEPLERSLVERLADTWPTIALLPQQVDTGRATGVDAGVARALETYRDLGFERTYHEPRAPPGPDASDHDSPRRARARARVVRNLYRHPERAPPVDDVTAEALDVTLAEPATVPDEVRGVARDLRSRLAEGTDPDDVVVVPTDPTRYADRIREAFDGHGIPFDLRTETALPETALGAVVADVCRLAREPRRVDTLLALLANPLVDPDHDGTGEPIDHRELSRVAARADTTRLDTVLAHVGDDTTAAVDSLVEAATSLADASLEALAADLDALLARLGVTATLDPDDEVDTAGADADSDRVPLSPARRSREQRARDRLDRVLETLALTDPVADVALGDAVDRLERALATASIREPGGDREGHVAVCGLTDAAAHEFDRAYVLGLTDGHVPSEGVRSAFARPIHEAHPEFEQPDVSAEARSAVASLLASAASLRLSVPQRSVDGDPFVEADVLTELRRVVDRSPVTLDASDDRPAPDPLPGRPEDVQRRLGEAVADLPADRRRTLYDAPATTRVHELLDAAVDAGTFATDQRERMARGIACAAARGLPELTAFDGQLSGDAVERIHGRSDREPYSPSQLETYAACGFKYYAERGLGIEAPDDLTREPDAGVRGAYVHDVLEGYYRSLQSSPGEPVHPGPPGAFEARQRRLLDVALDRLDAAFADYPETAFQTEWLESVLAGLGTPADNDYYGPTESDPDGRPRARGLFYRFLEHEFDEPARTTGRPTWFEARVGNPYDAGTPIADDPAVVETPHGPVPVHGLIDRVETVPGTAPTQVVVRDYKTGGSVPGERDVLAGLSLQLPLYALMAESALGDGDGSGIEAGGTFDEVDDSETAPGGADDGDVETTGPVDGGVETVGAAYYQVSPPTSVSSRRGLVTSGEMVRYHGTDPSEVDTPLLRHSYPHFETHGAFRAFLEETTPRRLGELAAGIERGLYHPTVLDPSDAGCRYCEYADVCDVRSHRRGETIEAIDAADVPAYVPATARGLDPGAVVDDGGEE
jgi:ATP-dependent helicase/nuclease subunit B